MSEAEPDIRILQAAEVGTVGSVLGLARLNQGDGFYLVAWVGNDPVGHLHLALSDPPELQDVFVLPEFRRTGVARALTDAAERHAKVGGHGRMRLSVSVENITAQALYRRCGYLDIGLPPHRVKGTIVIRTGPIHVDDTLLTWEKVLA